MAINEVELTADILAAFQKAAASPGVGAQLIIATELSSAIVKQLRQAVVSPTTAGVPSMTAGPNPVAGTGELL